MKTDFNLTKLRDQSIQRKIPIISQATQDFLSTILKKKKPKNILEIGSAICYSTIFFAQTIKERQGVITSFEISYPAYTEGLTNIKHSKSKNITLYPFNFSKITAKKLIKNNIDFVFIDAQKSQYWNFMMKIANISNQQTTIIIDDVIKYRSKLDSLYKYLNKNQVKYQVLQIESDDGIMLINP